MSTAHIWKLLSSGSAAPPAHPFQDSSAARPVGGGYDGKDRKGVRSKDGATQTAHHPSDAESSMAPLVTHNPACSADQPVVLQCLDRGGWLVTPLVNGCRLVSLSRKCKQALEGWPNRLERFELEKTCSTSETARKVQWLARHCPNLRHLVLDTVFQSGGYDLAFGRFLMSEAIQAVAKSCPRLRYLDLTWLPISTAALIAVARASPQLERLFVSTCSVTDAALWAVAESCPQLKELDVAQNPGISNTAIQAVARACPQLKRLNVISCTNLSDEAIVAVASNCHELAHLYVVAVYSLTDAAFQAVAQGCRQLKALNASHCAQLTDAAMRSLARGCVQLEWLTMRHCPLLTSAAVQALEEGCRQLTYLDMHPLREDDEIEIEPSSSDEIEIA